MEQPFARNISNASHSVSITYDISERETGHDDRGGERKRRIDYGHHVSCGRDNGAYRKDRHECRNILY